MAAVEEIKNTQAETVEEVVEEVEDSSSESDAEEAVGEDGAASKQSRAEKKSRKAVQKLGMKPVPGITQVLLSKNKNVFVIDKPDVFRLPGSDAYVILGEARSEDFAAKAAQQQAQRFQAAAAPAAASTSEPAPAPAAAAAPAEAVAEADDEEVDAEGVAEKDIELVCSQTGVSKARAVQALKAANNDIVSAIMELTM